VNQATVGLLDLSLGAGRVYPLDVLWFGLCV
jgi:hypothetical protein